MSDGPRGPWIRPRFHSVQVPVVEELLAESYKKKAELWAEAAGLMRREKAAREAKAEQDRNEHGAEGRAAGKP